jgi:branched-chain amino acid transport system substrate-binding protein
MKKILWLVVLVVVLIIIYAVSGGSQQSQEAGDQTGPIKIGYVGPLTGELASVGEPGLGGAELAVKEINEAGGLLGRQLELIAEDDACSAKGLNAITKLVRVDKVAAITGPDCSPSAGPGAPVAQEAGVPIVLRWASAPHLTLIGDYVFRVYPSDAAQGVFIAKSFVSDFKVQKAAILYIQNDWGKGLRDVFVKSFPTLGGTVVYDEGILPETSDLRTQLEKVKASGAQALFFPVFPTQAVPGLKQAKELGLKMPIVGGDAFDADEILKSPSAEGVYYLVGQVDNTSEFQKRVSDVTGKKGDKITASMAYDGVNVIAAAIKAAGSTAGPAVRDALAKTNHKGVSAPVISFDENGDLKDPRILIKKVSGGKSVPYQP